MFETDRERQARGGEPWCPIQVEVFDGFFGSQKRPMDGHPIAMTYVTFVKTGATFLWLSE